MNRVTFTKIQREYGDLSLVDAAIERLGLEFPLEHPFQRGGYSPDPVAKVQLQRAEKAIGHSDWRRYFRPDLWQPHTYRVTEQLGDYDVLSYDRISFNDEIWVCRCAVDDLNAHRLLYLTALMETHG